MARFLRALQRPYFSSSSSSASSIKTQFHALPQRHQQQLNQAQHSTSPFISQVRTSHTLENRKSPFESNILRLLHNEIQYQSDYAPPHEPATGFNSFTVENWPGEQWIRLRGKFGDNEDIKIEVTMFDGGVLVPNPGDDSTEQNVRLHISVLIDISKSDDSEALEFVCSAWPDCLEIRKVYLLRRDKLLPMPYMGPDFKSLDDKVQRALHEFLEARGVNDELSVFLHEYMTNKDRIELIHWLGNVKSFVEE